MNKKTVIGDGSGYVSTLVATKTPHKIIYTNNSVRVIVDDNEIIFSEKQISLRDLGFIGRCKKSVIENAERINLPERSPIFYKIYRMKFGQYEKLFEIDISSAFWDTAFECGIISDRIFNQGETVDKDVRLMAFGSAAAVKRSFVFDGERYTDPVEEVNEYGRRAYFYVASQVVSLMREICDQIPGAACLYWVDAIVCVPEYREFVCKKIFESGYQMKVKVLEKCHHFQDKSGAKIWDVIEKETGRQKQFKEFPKRSSRGVPGLINNFLDNK